MLGLRDQGEGEPTPAGPDSAWSWSSFPVGNSELPPATAARKGRLSHLRQGWGSPHPPTPTLPTAATPSPHSWPTANCPPSHPAQPSQATDREGRSEGEGGACAHHTPDPRRGRRLVHQPLSRVGAAARRRLGEKAQAESRPPGAWSQLTKYPAKHYCLFVGVTVTPLTGAGEAVW